MLGIIYVYYKFPPGESQLSLLLFCVCTAATIVGSLVSSWVLATRWSSLTVGERAWLIFGALFL
jgi:hypothetical protein